MADIDMLTYLVMAADADTPAGSLPYAGRIVGLRAVDMTQLGSGPDDVGVLLGIAGYPRTGGSTGTEFLMTPALDNVTRDFIRDIPSPKLWVDTNARANYRQVARILIRDRGVPAADVRSALKTLYDAAVANDRIA